MKINPYFIAFVLGVVFIAVAIGAIHGWPYALIILGIACLLVSLNF